MDPGCAVGTAGQRLLLTVEEAAECLCVGRTYMFDLIARGVVPSVRLGKLRIVRRDAMFAYVERLGAKVRGGEGCEAESDGADAVLREIGCAPVRR